MFAVHPPHPGDLSGHIGAAFDTALQFEGAAKFFLGAGLAKGEQLMFVADDPDPSRWPPSLLESGALQIASTKEIYGSEVRPDQQRATFAEAVAAALDQGYSGIRVAADNTSLVLDHDQVAAWTAWEIVADDFMAEAPVTGLCGFHRRRLHPQFVRFLVALHPTAFGTDRPSTP